MSKVNLAISGCMGRMGQQLVKSSKVDKNFKLTTLTENKLIKKKIKYTIFGIIYVLAILILGAYFYKEGIGII